MLWSRREFRNPSACCLCPHRSTSELHCDARRRNPNRQLLPYRDHASQSKGGASARICFIHRGITSSTAFKTLARTTSVVRECGYKRNRRSTCADRLNIIGPWQASKPRVTVQWFILGPKWHSPYSRCGVYSGTIFCKRLFSSLLPTVYKAGSSSAIAFRLHSSGCPLGTKRMILRCAVGT